MFELEQLNKNNATQHPWAIGSTLTDQTQMRCILYINENRQM